jgi:hypothetical protein
MSVELLSITCPGCKEMINPKDFLIDYVMTWYDGQPKVCALNQCQKCKTIWTG